MRSIQATLLFSLLAPTAESLPLLTIEPIMGQVQSGTNFDVSINVTGISDLYAYQFDVAYSPGLLQAQTVGEGAFLRDMGSSVFLPGQIDNRTGGIHAIADTRISQGPGVSGDGVLAVITFRAVGTGLSPLTLAGITLLNSHLEGIPFASNPTSLMVAPEPGALGLLLIGMLALFFCREPKFRQTR